MKFRVAHKATSYLMVASTLGTLAVTGTLGLIEILSCLAIGTLSWFAEPDTVMSRWLLRLDLPLKVLVLGFFSLTVFSLVQAFPEPDLTSLLDLVLVLQGYKLLQRKNNRDYLQIYILSFLLILAASWLAQTALFAIGFAVYVIALVWALILFHLRREIEDNYLVKHEATSAAQRVTAGRVLDSRRVVGRSFFYATAGASLMVLIGATLVFVFAPRIGIGFLMGSARRHSSVVGFSDQVELGRNGAISSDNQTVILHVGLSRLVEARSDNERDAAIAGLYWRGTVYDTYDKGQWLRSRLDVARTKVSRSTGDDNSRWTWIAGPEDQAPKTKRPAVPANAERQEIQLMGVSLPVAFALDRPVAFNVAEPALGTFLSTVVEPRYSGEAALTSVRSMPSGRTVALADFAGAKYVVYSVDSIRGAKEGQAKDVEELPEELLKPYLQVPDPLRARLAGLVHRLTDKAPTPAAKAQAVADWLKRNKRYSVDLKRDPSIQDPLEDFLFVQPSGHCEYFASAAAILLRLAGIPTRYVNGYLGGEWNALTKLVTVRDNRAHAWIEAYFSGFGWTRLDTTPALPRTSRMGRLKQLADQIELWWGNWVLDYNAGRQVSLARNMAKSLGLKSSAGSRFHFPKLNKQVVYSVIGLGLVAYLVAQLRKRRRAGALDARGQRAAFAGTSHRLYQRVQRALEPLGLRKGVAETPRELLDRVSLAHPALAPAMDSVIRAYERARFGERGLTAVELGAMAEATVQVEVLCREAARARKAA